MATRRKKTSKKSPKKKPKKGYPASLKADKTEKLSWNQIIRDERTWKIIGSVSLAIALFLLIAFVSYFFTWKEDQNEVFHAGFSILFNNNVHVHNLLGRLGALFSHFFIYKGFGIASLLICTFFFVAGVNLLFSRKVFSVRRNLKYVTIGLLVLSVSLHFAFASIGSFPFGGGVGKMVSEWLVGILGTIGTAALLIVLWLGYFIWQFNPAFNLPEKSKEPILESEEAEEAIPAEEDKELVSAMGGKTVNDLYAETDSGNGKANFLKQETGSFKQVSSNDALSELKLIERDEPTPEEIDKMEEQQPTVEKEVVKEILHQHDINEGEELSITDKMSAKNQEKNNPDELQLEIRTGLDQAADAKIYENLPPYEPTLDLRDYKYPTLSLLDTHGSEKIIQDANELENNKNQIIATLRNYDIEIQKISATVGPTVTLYEIVPSAGITNFENKKPGR